MPENESELAARAVLEAELGCSLVRVEATTGAEVVDYRTPSGDKAFEVKRLTSESFHAMGAAYARLETAVEDHRLTGYWTVLVQRADLSTILPQHGEVSVFGDGRSARLKNLAADLVDPFAILEKYGISKPAVPLPAPHMAVDLATALTTIAARVGGSRSYLRSDAPAGQAGRVVVLPVHGSVRTGVPDTLVDRLDQWLDSNASANLRKSLANESTGTERVAVLVFDSTTEPEVRSAEEQGAEFCPTRAPVLPAEVDVVWILVGPVACRYDPAEGWTARLAPPGAAT